MLKGFGGELSSGTSDRFQWKKIVVDSTSLQLHLVRKSIRSFWLRLIVVDSVLLTVESNEYYGGPNLL